MPNCGMYAPASETNHQPQGRNGDDVFLRGARLVGEYSPERVDEENERNQQVSEVKSNNRAGRSSGRLDRPNRARHERDHILGKIVCVVLNMLR